MDTQILDIPVNSDCYETWKSLIHGDRIAFYRVEPDLFAENPMDDDESNGTIYSLGRRHNNYNPDKVYDAIENNPDAVKLSYFEHGQCRWFVAGSRAPAGVEFQFDGVEFAGVWIPNEEALDNINTIVERDARPREDVLREYAAAVCVEYTNYCNGEIYSYQLEVYKLLHDSDGNDIEDRDHYEAHGHLITDDTCSGFNGSDTVEEELTRAVRSALVPV